jgi:hypothetical protein
MRFTPSATGANLNSAPFFTPSADLLQKFLFLLLALNQGENSPVSENNNSRHQRLKMSMPLFKCQFCDRVSIYELAMKAHIKGHTEATSSPIHIQE